MLLKLLKYDIKSSYLKIVMSFLAYIAIASALMIFFRNHEKVNTVVLTFGIIALCVITFLIIFQRYNENFYHNEGYFMFTIPVDGRMLLASKLISAFIWILALVLIIVFWITILVFYYGESGYINDTYKFIEINKTYAIILGINYLVNIIQFVLVIYFSISVSKLPIWRRFSLMAGLVISFVLGILNLLSSFLFRKVAHHTNTITVINNLIEQVLINKLLVQCLFELFILVVLFFATAYLLDNRTSLK
ncbi:hypothetical protein G9F71_024830 [Clostridium sp. FP2]|uniref:hypothetical protein n=1 Tax=Clostridium sp. FP2 TaxID=2724481 RepID=UPI0013E97ED7|nr:hypothetical protein [Clostridium sp. FP2]MBZ9626034.1 hypothetical protein [Clostridium sp. FP2]